MPRYIDVDAYIKYCEENWIPLNIDVVKAQPTTDVVERKKGKWLIDPPEGVYQLYKCSVCGYLWAYWYASAMPVEKMTKDVRCCPKCFAEMEV